MGGHTIEVKMHSGTKDQTKIQIFGMPPGTEWQEVKDHFGQIGQVAFSEAYDPSVALTGYIRYDDPAHAQLAVNMLNGTMLGGAPISIELDYASRDMSKLIIQGIPAGIEWQELKDHFKSIGSVAYSDVLAGKGSGKGKTGKKGGMGTNLNPEMMQVLSGLMQGNGGDGNMTEVANLVQAIALNQMQQFYPAGSGRVTVRGFDFGTTEQQLRTHMGLAGKVLNVIWTTQGSADVVYESRAAAEMALSLDKSTLWGNTRFVDVILK